MTAVLVGLGGLDAFDANAEAEPPDGEPAQVEEGVRGCERDPVVAADVGREAALAKEPLKHGKGIGFFGGGEGFTGEQKPAGVVGDGQRVAIVLIAEEELAFVIGAPQFIGSVSER